MARWMYTFSFPLVPVTTTWVTHTALLQMMAWKFHTSNTSSVKLGHLLVPPCCVWVMYFSIFYLILEHSWFTMFCSRYTTKWVSCTYTFFFRFFSRLGYYRVLNRVSYAIQQVLIINSHLFHTCVFVDSNFPIYPSPLFHFGSHKFLFSICDSISVLQISPFVPFFFDAT